MSAREAIRARAATAADWIAAALAASLPVSTSATVFLFTAFLIAALLSLDRAALRRETMSAAGVFAVALCAVAALGMLWANVGWGERLHGLTPYLKLLVIPVMLVHFRRSGRGWRVAAGFLAAATVVLVWSYWYAYWPGLAWRGKEFGVPVKDYITQSGVFVICIFGLADAALAQWRKGARALALGTSTLALLFFANIVFVTSGRTALVVLPVLALIFVWRHFGARGAIASVVFGGLLALAIWNLSPYLRTRVLVTLAETESYRTTTEQSSTGQRLEFWRKSLRFMQDAPLFGHGTGTIRDQFSKAVSAKEGPGSLVSTNPHQQVFAVGIQLGLFGIAILLAMWWVHGALFRGPGATAWIGLLVVIQNVVGSMFNSHLFDFTQGWIYVVGVGVFGGMMLRERDGAEAKREGSLQPFAGVSKVR